MKRCEDLIVFHNRIILGLLIFLFCSCKKENNQNILLNKITNLNEYELAQKRVDSFNNIGIPLDISISILSNVSSSFYPEDSLKNLSYALIQERNGFDDKILFIVKYDSLTNNIIEVVPNK